MGIRDLEEKLFAQWRTNRPGFVADGVADETFYLSTTPRLLFILKEVNDPNGGDWDLRQFMREGGRKQTWDNITRWVEGIRKLRNDIPWSDLEDINEERRRTALLSIAAINLMKSPGGHTTDAGLLAATATQDKALINEQFGFYNPNLVICCGVSDIFHWLVDLGAEPQWRKTKRGVWFHEFKPKKFVVAFSHPEARCADNLLYYGLVDAIREIYET